MKIIYLNGENIQKGTVAAIGFFDGVHLAHRHLLETTHRIGLGKGIPTAIITFDVHPKSVLNDERYTYITPLNKKIELLREYDSDTIYLIAFTKDKARLSPEHFIQHYLRGLDTLVCGFDFHFGAGASGNVDTLKKHARFDTVVIEEMTINQRKIGSTHIRSQIEEGRVDAAKDMLGDYYSLSGRVVHGKNKGVLMGYPTANIEPVDYLLPKRGVYATWAKIANEPWRPAFTNIGCQPTVRAAGSLCVETHVFDFSKNVYGKTLDVKFVARLRDEMMFPSIRDLVAQIDHDKAAALALLKKTNNPCL